MNDDKTNIDNIIESSEELKNIHHEIDDTIKNELDNTEKISNTNSDMTDILDNIRDKNQEIVQISREEYFIKQSINDLLEDKKNKQQEILNADSSHINNILTIKEEYKNICGYTNDILNNLNNALNVQQQLNNATKHQQNINSNAVNNSNGGNGNNARDNQVQQARSRQRLKWYSKERLAHTSLQTSINILTKFGSDVLNKWIEIDKKVFTTGRQMGMTATQIRGWQQNILQNYDEMANRLGMTFAEIFKFQENYQQAVGKAVILSNKQTESFAGISKFAGENGITEMVKSMDYLGSSSQRTIDYLTLNMARASSQGLSIKESSEKFAANIKMASRYNFKNGIDGINKMTLLSQKLKFNMESISSALDTYSSLDSAISASAQLQVLGGAYAANFANPVLAAGEAMLDPEEFTKKMIDTFAQNAVFDREKGEVTMSPIEKAKLKEASTIFKINFDEAWNMAAQSAKIKDIESHIDPTKFTENQKAFLANTAQYDAEKKIWTVTKMTENGAEKINIADLKSGKDLEGIQEENNFEKFIQGDVHSIRSMLAKYLGERVDETKTAEEIKTGQTERLKIFGANFIDPLANLVKNWVKDLNLVQFAILGVTTQILRQLMSNGIGNMARGRSRGNTPSRGGGGGSANRGAKGSIWKRGVKRGVTRTGLKMFGKSGLKGIGKSIPVIGSLLSVGLAASDIYTANKEHKDRVNDINDNATLSAEEKSKARSKSKQDRNTKVGGSIGGAAGSILAGAAVGAAMSGPLAPVGALVGGIAGYFAGDALGSFIGSKINTEEKAKPQVKNTTNETNSSTIVTNSQNSSTYIPRDGYSLSIIQTDVSAIKDTIIKQNIQQNPRESIRPYNQYEQRTYIRDNNTNTINTSTIQKPFIERIDLNINGTLRVQSNNNTQNVDISGMFNSPEFQRLLLNKINESLSRNTNAVQTRTLDSTQSIMGGYYTPNQMNSK